MTAPLILDSSAILSCLLPDEATQEKEDLLDEIAVHGAHVPNLWALEVGNSLLVAERRQRIDTETRLALLGALTDLPIHVDPHTSDYALNKTSALAAKYGLSVYDAAYLELSLRLKGRLASCDKALVNAAIANQVALAFIF